MKRKLSAPVKVGLLILFLVFTGVMAFFAHRWARSFFLDFTIAQLPGLAVQDTLTPGDDQEQDEQARFDRGG